MTENFGFGFQGTVIIKCGQREFVYKNAIMPTAYEIVASRLANINSSIIDAIKVYNNSILKASKLISRTEKISATEVQFLVSFEPPDFSGDFDEVQLWSESIGPFSKLIGFNQNKPDQDPLAILWKIKVITP